MFGTKSSKLIAKTPKTKEFNLHLKRGLFARLVPIVMLLAVAGVAALIIGKGTAAQTESTVTQSPRPAPKPDPPGTIDGKKNPELIPDEVAYRLVLIALAEPEDATDAEKARYQAKIRTAGLSTEDRDALFQVLGALHKQQEPLKAQAREIKTRNPFPFAGTPDYQKLLDLSKQREQAIAEAKSAIPARLSLAGASKLQAYVENEKHGMKYLPDMPMTGQ